MLKILTLPVCDKGVLINLPFKMYYFYLMKFHFGQLKYRYTMKTVTFFALLILTWPTILMAQAQKDKPAVTFEELYDEPYSINKFFIGFQPLYGELFATNVNSGFGIEGKLLPQGQARF